MDFLSHEKFLYDDECISLGKGSYGIVFELKEASTKKKSYVIKRNFYSKDETLVGSYVLKEYQMLKKLQNHDFPFVTRLSGVMDNEELDSLFEKSNLQKKNIKITKEDKNDKFHFIFEKEDSSLNKLLFKSKDHFPTVTKIVDAVTDLVLGLFWIHLNGILHQDIKPGNILMTKEKGFSYCDFGLSSFFKDKHDKLSNRGIMTVTYRAPEICLNQDYNYKVDIWSLGAVFFEILTNKRFIDDEIFTPSKNENKIMLSFLSKKFPSQRKNSKSSFYEELTDYGKIIEKKVSLNAEYPNFYENYMYMVSRMLLLDVEKRFSFIDLINEIPFLKENGKIKEYVKKFYSFVEQKKKLNVLPSRDTRFKEVEERFLNEFKAFKKLPSVNEKVYTNSIEIFYCYLNHFSRCHDKGNEKYLVEKNFFIKKDVYLRILTFMYISYKCIMILEDNSLSYFLDGNTMSQDDVSFIDSFEDLLIQQVLKDTFVFV